MNIQVKPVENVIEKGAQVSQSLNVECVDHFAILPKLVVQFVINNVPHKFDLQIPITINKFFEPTAMNSEQFFQRWKNLNKYVIFKNILKCNFVLLCCCFI